MAFKFVCLLACLAVARAGVLHQPLAYAAAPVAVARTVETVVDSEYDPNPQYSYSYGVHDSVTGDVKGQVESRSGDIVTGQYSLVDSDGTKRTVDYTADPVNGFNAVVSKTPLAGHAVVASAPTVVQAEPAVIAARTVAAPSVAYSAPSVVAARTVAAPAVAYSSPAVATYSTGAHLVSAPGPLAYSSYGHVAAGPAVVARTVSGPVGYASHVSSAPAGVISTYNTPGVVARTISGPVAYSSHVGAPVAYSSHIGAPVSYSSPLVNAW